MLEEQGDLQTFSAGEVIFGEGTKGNKMYIIQNGSVEIYKNTDGSTVSLAVLKPHEFFGEMAFFDNTRSASAKALEDSEILVINKEIFSSFIKEPIVWQVLEKMGQRIKETDDRLINYWSCKVQQHD